MPSTTMEDSGAWRRRSSTLRPSVEIHAAKLSIKSDPDGVPKSHVTAGMVTFTLVGFISLLIWNIILNTVNNISTVLYDSSSMADTMVAIYQTFNISAQLCLIYFGGVRPVLFISAGCCLGAMALIIPVIVQYASEVVAESLLYGLMAPVGSCVGLVLGCGFTFASIMPVNFCGYVALGMGVSGLFSFGLWMVISKAIFDCSTPEGLMGGIWLIFSIGVFICFAVSAWVFLTLQQPWASHAAWRVIHGSTMLDVTRDVLARRSGADVDSTESQHLEKEQLDYITEGPVEKTETEPQLVTAGDSESPPLASQDQLLGWWPLLKTASMQLFNMGLTMWITMNVFPVIGPYSWQGPSIEQSDITMGMFQMGDFVGRYLPNAGTIPYVRRIVMINPKLLWIPVLLRLLFIPIFVVSYKVHDTTVLNDLWYQILLMLVFSLTDGWFATLSVIYNTDQFQNEKDKGRAGLMGSIIMLVGVVGGLWMSKLYKIGS
eukprot:GHVQ01024481.1.p1 GENE.GHVQ01024481.1~~GHVQ01024481.1.p1  ORF type:complete len:488 (-),score=27.90 GHVQ01024481.1:1923-3386(-)